MKLLDTVLKNRLDEKLKRLNALRPLPPSAVKKLREQFEIEMTFNSNGIEGNALTLKETYLVISQGITVRNKPLKDHLEARGHYEALEFLVGLVERDRRHTLSEKLLRELHAIIIGDIDKEWAGRYRSSDVRITGSSHRPPSAVEVPAQMHRMIAWATAQLRRLHPVELAAIAHHRFVQIHPFFDGNGRVGRLLMNVLLMRSGYPLAVILKNDRKRYYNVLDRADRGDLKPLVRFAAQSVERSLDIYLKALTPAGSTAAEKLMPLSALAKKTRYSAKYLNLLVRQGKLAAHKEGRVWLSSQASVERYISGRQRKR